MNLFSVFAKVVDKVVPVGVGKRTAIGVFVDAVLKLAVAFGVDVPPVVSQVVDGLVVAFAVSHVAPK